MFVLGIGGLFLWRAYQEELKYSKGRDAQTLTVLAELTRVMKDLENREAEMLKQQAKSSENLMVAVTQLTDMVRKHTTDSKLALQSISNEVAKIKDHQKP